MGNNQNKKNEDDIKISKIRNLSKISKLKKHNIIK